MFSSLWGASTRLQARFTLLCFFGFFITRNFLITLLQRKQHSWGLRRRRADVLKHLRGLKLFLRACYTFKYKKIFQLKLGTEKGTEFTATLVLVIEFYDAGLVNISEFLQC